MTNYEIKYEARETLSGKWIISTLTTLAPTVLFLLFLFIPPYSTQEIQSPTTGLTATIPYWSTGLTIYIFLIWGISNLLTTNFFFNYNKFSLSPIKKFTKATLTLWLLLSIIIILNLISAIPLNLIDKFYPQALLNTAGDTSLGIQTTNFPFLSLSILATFALLIFGLLQIIRISQVYYLLAQNPEIKFFQAFTQSYKLMKGKFWKYILLQLSFIGWWFLALAAMLVILSPFFLTNSIYMLLVALIVSLLPFYVLSAYKRTANAVFFRMISQEFEQDNANE